MSELAVKTTELNPENIGTPTPKLMRKNPDTPRKPAGSMSGRRIDVSVNDPKPIEKDEEAEREQEVIKDREERIIEKIEWPPLSDVMMEMLQEGGLRFILHKVNLKKKRAIFQIAWSDYLLSIGWSNGLEVSIYSAVVVPGVEAQAVKVIGPIKIDSEKEAKHKSKVILRVMSRIFDEPAKRTSFSAESRTARAESILASLRGS